MTKITRLHLKDMHYPIMIVTLASDDFRAMASLKASRTNKVFKKETALGGMLPINFENIDFQK